MAQRKRKITALDRLAEQLAKNLVSRGICAKGILDINQHKPTEQVLTSQQQQKEQQ